MSPPLIVHLVYRLAIGDLETQASLEYPHRHIFALPANDTRAGRELTLAAGPILALGRVSRIWIRIATAVAGLWQW